MAWSEERACARSSLHHFVTGVTDTASAFDYFHRQSENPRRNDMTIKVLTQGNDPWTGGETQIYGLNGDDTINTNATADQFVYGGQGNDTVNELAVNGVAHFYGDDGNDTLKGFGG